MCDTRVENREFIKMLYVIGMPILAQNFISAMVNLADTIMVSSLGDIPVAAVGASNQIYFILNLIFLGISSGIAVFMAQYWGKKDLTGLKKSVLFGLSILIPFIALVTIFIVIFPDSIIGFFTNDVNVVNEGMDYLKIVCWSYIPAALSVFLSYSLRSIERIKISVCITVAALLMNVILNYLLIFGIWIFPELGVKGAALATLISRILQAAAIIIAIYAKQTAIAVKRFSDYKPELAFIKRFVNASGSVFLNELLFGIGGALFFAVIGKAGTELFAGANIARQVETMIWIFFWSMCACASVSIGKLIGEGKYNKAQKYANKFIWSSLIISIVLAAVLLACTYPIMSWFNVTSQAKDTIQLYLTIFSCVILFRGPIKVLTGGVMRAGGDTLYVLLWDIIPQYIAILSCILVSRTANNLSTAILIIMLSYEAVKVVPTLLRIKSGKWINNLVADK